MNMNLIRKAWDVWTNEKGYPEDQVEDMIKFHDKCADAFRDARTAITIIENATPDEARSAFLRICRVGVQMSQEDFDKAVNWSAQTA
jgi:biotin synthase-related radical SAM superfamily protein